MNRDKLKQTSHSNSSLDNGLACSLTGCLFFLTNLALLTHLYCLQNGWVVICAFVRGCQCFWRDRLITPVSLTLCLWRDRLIAPVILTLCLWRDRLITPVNLTLYLWRDGLITPISIMLCLWRAGLVTPVS